MPDALVRGTSRRRLRGALQRRRDRRDPCRRRRGHAGGRTRPSIFFCGRHEERKGLRVLIEAVRAIRRRRSRSGSASTGPDTTTLMRRTDGDERFQWLGRITDVEKFARLRAARRVLRAVARRRVVRRRPRRGDGRRHDGRRQFTRRLPQRRHRRRRRAARRTRAIPTRWPRRCDAAIRTETARIGPSAAAATLRADGLRHDRAGGPVPGDLRATALRSPDRRRPSPAESGSTP